MKHIVPFLAALAALYLTLVSHSVTDSVTHRHFRISTQRVTFETWDQENNFNEDNDNKDNDNEDNNNKDNDNEDNSNWNDHRND